MPEVAPGSIRRFYADSTQYRSRLVDGVRDLTPAQLAIAAGPDRLVRSAHLFDLYKPAAATPGFAIGERSLAVRLELLDDGATLTDERVDAEVARLLERLRTDVGARLRA